MMPQTIRQFFHHLKVKKRKERKKERFTVLKYPLFMMILNHVQRATAAVAAVCFNQKSINGFYLLLAWDGCLFFARAFYYIESLLLFMQIISFDSNLIERIDE